ncbi:Uncharacterised protein [uncultured archaeon]|nr:Uncharacterised protein [uncultured archaeon]
MQFLILLSMLHCIIKRSNLAQCQNLFKQKPEEGTIHLVVNELRRRLAEYKLMDKTFPGEI